MLLVAIVTGAKAADIVWDFSDRTEQSLTSNKSYSFTATDGTTEMRYSAGSSDAIIAKDGDKSGYLKENGGTSGGTVYDIDGKTNVGKTRLIRLFVTGKGKLTINCNGTNGKYKVLNGSASGTSLISELSANTQSDEINVTSSLIWIETSKKGYITSIVWTPSGPAKAYTVTAATNNSAYGTASTSASSLDKGETATITATPKPGYEFTSWAVEGEGAELSSTTTNPTTLTIGTSDATVTATFSIATLNITHNDAENGTYTISVAGGEATDANTTATIGQTITLAGTPALPSFTAVSWNVKDANNNNVTVTDNQFTMPGSSVTISPVFSKPSVIKVTIGGSKSATVSGSIGGTADVDLSTAGKMDKNKYAGFTLAGENTFQEGDIINVNIKTAAGAVDGKTGTIIFYDTKTGAHALMETGVVGVVGDNKFVVNSSIVGNQTIYLYRSGDNAENPWNAVINYIEVIRADATVTLNAKGYATYSKATDFEFAGAKAYKMALNESTKTITGTEVTGKIAAGEGILLKGEAGAKIAITESTGATALEGNSLKGTTTASGKATVPTYCYTLSGDTFKKFKGDAFNDNKAYLESENDLSGQSLEIIFDDQPTAISFVVEDDANVAAAPVKTIKNGQLFIGNYNVAGARIK